MDQVAPLFQAAPLVVRPVAGRLAIGAAVTPGHDRPVVRTGVSRRSESRAAPPHPALRNCCPFPGTHGPHGLRGNGNVVSPCGIRAAQRIPKPQVAGSSPAGVASLNPYGCATYGVGAVRRGGEVRSGNEWCCVIVLLISARSTQGSGTTTDHQTTVTTATTAGGAGVTSTIAFGARFSAIDDEAAKLA